MQHFIYYYYHYVFFFFFRNYVVFDADYDDSTRFQNLTMRVAVNRYLKSFT